MARTRLYRDGRLEAEGFPVADVSHCDPSAVVWLDLCAPSAGDLKAISEDLGLHELAVEDALQQRHRPKLDVYDGHMFLNVYAVRFDAESGRLHVADAAAFITRNALVTVRKSEDFAIDEVVRRWDEAPGLAANGVAFLLHGLLDYVVDSHFAVVEAMDAAVEALEETVFAERPVSAEDQRCAFEMRKGLVTLRRVVVPMREVVNTLLRRCDGQFAGDSMAAYFLDVYDQVLRAAEWTESLRDLLSNIREAHLTMQANRMNMVMKRVTSWAAIIAVPTMITGFYGQNIPFPGYGAWWGVLVSSAAIVIASAVLYAVFRARDWL